MWPFDGRSQRPMPVLLREILNEIPREFLSDGCSNVRDSIFGFDFRMACRAHNWMYCTRCHPAGTMTMSHKAQADQDLGMFIRAMLPRRWRWVGWWYRTGVHWAGGVSAFDSCGPTQGQRCRHGMAQPEWMAANSPTPRT